MSLESDHPIQLFIIRRGIQLARKRGGDAGVALFITRWFTCVAWVRYYRFFWTRLFRGYLVVESWPDFRDRFLRLRLHNVKQAAAQRGIKGTGL